METARFIPPDPIMMQDALLNWEAYVTSETDDPITAAAIAHAQFEIIHPFNDGNGRIGRMIIPLMLTQRRVISAPTFYVSEYLEANRAEYYDRLLAVTRDKDWDGWIAFFTEALAVQAETNFNRTRSLHVLQTDMRERFVEATRSQYASRALDVFFLSPIVTSNRFLELGGFESKTTANHILRQLETAGLIERIRAGKGRKPALYAMWSIIRTAQGRA